MSRPGALQLAGAKVPANRAGHALAVLISSAGVEYTSEPSDGSDQSSSEGDRKRRRRHQR